jgi:hypothetical protein
MTPSGMEPTPFRLVAQCLNHLLYLILLSVECNGLIKVKITHFQTYVYTEFFTCFDTKNSTFKLHPAFYTQSI